MVTLNPKPLRVQGLGFRARNGRSMGPRKAIVKMDGSHYGAFSKGPCSYMVYTWASK